MNFCFLHIVSSFACNLVCVGTSISLFSDIIDSSVPWDIFSAMCGHMLFRISSLHLFLSAHTPPCIGSIYPSLYLLPPTLLLVKLPSWNMLRHFFLSQCQSCVQPPPPPPFLCVILKFYLKLDHGCFLSHISNSLLRPVVFFNHLTKNAFNPLIFVM